MASSYLVSNSTVRETNNINGTLKASLESVTVGVCPIVDRDLLRFGNYALKICFAHNLLLRIYWVLTARVVVVAEF